MREMILNPQFILFFLRITVNFWHLVHAPGGTQNMDVLFPHQREWSICVPGALRGVELFVFHGLGSVMYVLCQESLSCKNDVIVWFFGLVFVGFLVGGREVLLHGR